MINENSFDIAKKFLGRTVEVIVDRPKGAKHPGYDLFYEVNYGYIDGVKAPDGEWLDAYYLGADKPLTRGTGECIAIIHRLSDDDDKLVVVPAGFAPTDQEIETLVYFQEKWFDHEIVRVA